MIKQGDLPRISTIKRDQFFLKQKKKQNLMGINGQKEL